jgi:hypothetical protein
VVGDETLLGQGWSGSTYTQRRKCCAVSAGPQYLKVDARWLSDTEYSL